ncbi:MAG: hypothetical protein JNK34_04265 [Tabrizicola sp.]|nr:hypothetical protein [Tabrizicola sp.]
MVFDFLRKAPVEAVPERKASAVGRVVAWGNAGRVAWSPRDTASLTRTGFQGNPVGFRVVRLIAEAAAALPLVCQTVEQRFDTHPVLDLISPPNGAQGRAEFLEAVYRRWPVSGTSNGHGSPRPISCPSPKSGCFWACRNLRRANDGAAGRERLSLCL